MGLSRLTTAVQDGAFEVSEDARIAVFAPHADMDLSALPSGQCDIIQTFKPDYEAFAARGFACNLAPSGSYDIAVVSLPRSKVLAHALISQAAAVADLVVVDGQKTDGSDSVYKACRTKTDVLGVVSKAHGKLFWFKGGAFADWAEGPEHRLEDGFVTRPGVFSADGIDPASRALADALPEKIGRQVADLGGGWGYLSARLLAQSSKVETLHLVEADHVALECARLNVSDPRAKFHWADATVWQAPSNMDTVIMNPPFHTTRAADPALGRVFIAAAADMLAQNGSLWLVANRHLPYESELAAHFVQYKEVAGDNRFKVLVAQRPSRKRR